MTSERPDNSSSILDLNETDEIAYQPHSFLAAGGFFRSFRIPNEQVPRRSTSNYGSRIFLNPSTINAPVPQSAGLPESTPTVLFQRNNNRIQQPTTINAVASTEDFIYFQRRQPNFYRSVHGGNPNGSRGPRTYYCSDLVLNRENGANIPGFVSRPRLNLGTVSNLRGPTLQDRPIVFTERTIAAPPPPSIQAPMATSRSYQALNQINSNNTPERSSQLSITLLSAHPHQSNVSASQLNYVATPAHRVILADNQQSPVSHFQLQNDVLQPSQPASNTVTTNNSSNNNNSQDNILLFRRHVQPLDASARYTTTAEDIPNITAVVNNTAMSTAATDRLNPQVYTLSTESTIEFPGRVRRFDGGSVTSVAVGTDSGRGGSPPLREIRVSRLPRTLDTATALPSRNPLPAWGQQGSTSRSTSTSGASSVEDLLPGGVGDRIITPSRQLDSRRRRTVSEYRPPPAAETRESPEDEPDQMDNQKLEEQRELDWRAGTTGNLELWRVLLETGRFVDVIFFVGGPHLFCSTSSPRPPSLSDPGAPGGPTGISVVAQPDLTYSIDLERIASPNEAANDPGSPGLSAKTEVSSSFDVETVSTDNEDDLTKEKQQEQEANLKTAVHMFRDAFSHPTANSPFFHPRNTKSCRKLNHSTRGSLLGTTCSTSTELVDAMVENDSTVLLEVSDSTTVVQDDMALMRSMNSPFLSRYGPVDERQTVAEGQPLHHLLSQSERSSAYAMQSTAIWELGQSTRFPAHRVILAAASPVFEAMFYGPVADVHASDGGRALREFRIPDIHPKAFYSMLLYIYCEAIELSDDPDIVFYTLYAAKKYMLPHLARCCVERLKDMLTASNVCGMLDRCLLFDEEDLTHQCWHIVDILAPDVLKSDDLLKMDTVNLKALLSRDSLNCAELDVFRAVCRWSSAECQRLGLCDVLPNRSQVASEIMQSVRFPTMALSDFSKHVANSGFLSLEMVRDIFVHISTSQQAGDRQNQTAGAVATTTSTAAGAGTSRPVTSTMRQTAGGQLTATAITGSSSSALSRRRSNAKEAKASAEANMEQAGDDPPASGDLVAGCFLTRPRCGPRLLRCRRFTHTGRHLVPVNTSSAGRQHRITFAVSAPIFLAGVGIYGSTQAQVGLNVRVSLNSSVLSAGDLQFSSQPRSPVRVSRAGAGEVAVGAVVQDPDLLNRGLLLDVAQPAWSGRAHSTPMSSPSTSSILSNQSMDEDTAIVGRMDGQQRGHAPGAHRPGPLVVGRGHVESDGTNRVYDVRFPCPVRLEANRRYIIQVVSSPTSPCTPLTPASSFIGLFGRAEVKVFYPPIPPETEGGTEAPSVGPGKSLVDRRLRRQAAQRQQQQHRAVTSGPAVKQKEKMVADAVTFNFWDNPTATEPGEVDKGFLPELLFFSYV